MKNIYIVGYHQSPFGKLYDTTPEAMLRDAAMGLLEKLDAPPDLVDTVGLSGCCTPLLNDQLLLSGLLAQAPGFGCKMMDTAENACSSGGQAILNVIYRLLAGVADIGMAVGIEKMRDERGKMDGKRIGRVLGYASHPEQRPGKLFVFPHIFAEIMDLYMKEHGVTEEDLAHVPVTFYANANQNPMAQMHGHRLGLEDVLTIEGINRYIAPPLPLKTYECSQVSDGYAAIMLSTEAGLRKLSVPPERVVRVAGFGQRTDPLNVATRPDTLRPRGAFQAVRDATDMAGVTTQQISLAEVHDCFGIMGAMSAEILGKAAYGQGARYFVEGRARLDGDCPLNTSGGLIGKGHPIGATGIAMPGWCYQQIVGDVPPALQVKSIHHAATFNIGGPICASVVFVLRGAD